MKHSRHKEPPPPLDPERLDRLALAYVSRYATTRSKLVAYLDRKVKARGWEGETAPDGKGIADRLAELGLIDDEAFALAREASLRRRGLGQRRLAPVLRAAGIEAEDGALAHETAREHAWASALRFAERRRIGPFAQGEVDRATWARHFAMLMRAGHSPDIARRLLESDSIDRDGDGDV